MAGRVASLMVEIGANVSGFQAAAGQVRSGLNNIASSARSMNQQLFHAEGLMKGWSQAQYTASYNTERLASRASFLESRVKSGRMTVEQATSAWKGYTAEARRAEWQAMSLREKFSKTLEPLKNTWQHADHIAMNFGMATAAVAALGVGVYKFGRSGAEIEYTTQKFDRLARSVGSTGDVFLGQLRSATRGTVSDFGLLKQGSDLLQLGLAKDTKEAVRLSSVMTALGMDTGELTLALANQSKRRLDQLGLSLTKFNEIESRLKDAGMTKEAAFKEAFLQTAEQTILTTGNRADSAMAPFLQLQASASNVWNNFKPAAMDAISGDVQNFANFFRAIAAVQNGEMAWGGNLFEMMSGQKPMLISQQQNVAQLAQDQWVRNNTQVSYDYSRRGGAGVITTPPSVTPSAASFLYEDAAVRNARLRPAGSGGGATGEGATLDYAAMLDAGVKYTDIFEKYSDSVQKLNTKFSDNKNLTNLYKDAFFDLHEELRRGEITSKEYNASVRDLQQSWYDGSFAVEQQRAAIAGLNQEVTDTTEKWAAGMLDAKGATAEQQLEFSRATGQISSDAYEATKANDKLADAYMSGKISAGEYASALSQLTGWVKSMDGLQVDTYIDVWIREHGGGGLPIVSSRPAVCFVAGTQITMADGSRKPIELVEIGDVVLSYDTDTRSFVDGEVTQLFWHDTDTYLNLDGLLVTPEHPLWVLGRGWVRADAVNEGDLLRCDNFNTKRVENIIKVYANVVVYNLEVDDVHTYFAGGVLVHNKVAANAWTGGDLGDGFTVVGDAPGGIWGPHTEVIYGGHVFNAEQSRALRDAGLLDGAEYRGGGSGERSGSGTRSYRRTGGASERPGRTSTSVRTPLATTSVTGDVSVSGSSEAEVAASAASQVADNTAAMIVSTQQNTNENMQNQTQQQVQAQHESQAAIVEKLDEVARILKRQPDTNDMYAIFHGGQQTNI